MKGWVCLHRRLLDHPRFRDPEWTAVWIYLLLKATHQPMRIIFDGAERVLQPGQLVTGRYAIAEATGVNASKVRRILAALKTDHQIEQLSGTSGSILTVLNWGSYQVPDHPSGQPVANERPTTGQRPATNNNSNNITREGEAAPPAPPPSRPMGTGQRIGMENQLRILRERLKRLEGETAEQWQRDLHPELIADKAKLREEIAQLENRLLRS